MKCYAQALELDSSNCDAHVAQGAAFANQDRLEEAIHCFEQALQLQPSHPNAKKYMEMTTKRQAEQQAQSTSEAASAAEVAEYKRLQTMMRLDKATKRSVDTSHKSRDKKEKKKKKQEKKEKKKKKRDRSRDRSLSPSRQRHSTRTHTRTPPRKRSPSGSPLPADRLMSSKFEPSVYRKDLAR
mmetsp:Transcript_48569/g.113997  ORF Transcript_48569/g.113997 Transcript_48569/m.113997 type:complete len:183 (+) Transcript_48569:503-1051(+)